MTTVYLFLFQVMDSIAVFVSTFSLVVSLIFFNNPHNLVSAMDLFGGEITEVDSQAMESYEGSSLLKMPSDSFTLDLLRKKMEYNPNGNTIISPMGVMIVYSMLMEGADGETKDQLNQVLRLGTAFNDTDSVKKEFKKVN